MCMHGSRARVQGIKQNDGLDGMDYIALRLRGRVKEDNGENSDGQMNHSIFVLTLPTVVTAPGTSPSRFPT